MIILFFLIFPLLSAVCEDNQININTASQKELDNLYGIGEVKAQAIIDARPFNSIDELINVLGIGEITLQKIKEQGLACVEEDNVSQQEKETKNEKEKEVSKKEYAQEEVMFIAKDNSSVNYSNSKVINLNPKVIKSEDNIEEARNLSKSDYAMYGFIGFCVLLGFLLVKRKKIENEFRD